MPPEVDEFKELFALKLKENNILKDIITQLQEQGYLYVHGPDLETERSSENDVILERRLYQAIIRLNPDASYKDISNYLMMILKMRASSPIKGNKTFYEMLINNSSQRNTDIDVYNPLMIVDFDNPNNNEFLVVTEFTLNNEQHNKKLDCVIFINGLPLVILETLNQDIELNNAKFELNDYLQHYCEELFYCNQFMIMINNFETQIGLGPFFWRDIKAFKNFFPEISGKPYDLIPSQELLTSGLLRQQNVLQLIRKGITYEQVDRTITKRFVNDLVSPNGEDAINDRIAVTDLLGRDNLIRELGNFYTEYSEQNPFPFYFGVFGRWGMGKSSVNEMLTKNIEGNSSKEYEHLVLKIDCSMFHKKDKLWISILNDLLDLLSKKKVKKAVFQWNSPSFRGRFIWSNLISWLKSNWWTPSFILPIISLCYILYAIYTSSYPKNLVPQDFKEGAAFVSIVTFIYGLMKTVALLIKHNIFLQDKRNENSSYVQSLKEYNQFIELMNKVKKKKEIKILIILDELDRIHKDLLPDVIELIQIFKGLNNNESIEMDIKEKKENKSTISFAFSFNHDILFPIIGKNATLNDRQLLVNSYKKYKGFVEGKEKDAYIDYYKLGKEFMDKYLDLSIYLEEEIDYTKLIKKLFGKSNEFNNSIFPSTSNSTLMNEVGVVKGWGNVIAKGTDSNGKIITIPSSRNKRKVPETSNTQSVDYSHSFSEWEIELITKKINKYATKVEPRKVIRLKNALIMLKKLNKQTNTDMDTNAKRQYKDELEKFIIDFLDIDYSLGQDIDKIEEKKENLNVDLKSNKYLKFTEYFIHNNN
ncbi:MULTISPECIES: type I restriction endonuclease [Bacillus cereus group]|uniref:type I restriction endonuclease n=1 Tax=Bacillus cereus group TaxID=86661 RepID=UPI000279EEB8|nr:type I restriction endonuclease [Bacillus cereus]EJR29762.1 hypothetical protein IIE_05002 [Bacillus cereus VD045]HDR4347831.1 type I restriction endonuclease subunit R [Bacillus cereus]